MVPPAFASGPLPGGPLDARLRGFAAAAAASGNARPAPFALPKQVKAVAWLARRKKKNAGPQKAAGPAPLSPTSPARPPPAAVEPADEPDNESLRLRRRHFAALQREKARKVRRPPPPIRGAGLPEGARD